MAAKKKAKKVVKKAKKVVKKSKAKKQQRKENKISLSHLQKTTHLLGWFFVANMTPQNI